MLMRSAAHQHVALRLNGRHICMTAACCIKNIAQIKL